MNFIRYLSASIFLFGWTLGCATQCPDPETSSLKWGIPPAPWVTNPLSLNSPQAEANTQFVKADILVVGRIGRGVVCTYKISVGEYSIWWQAMTKIPARVDNSWIETASGYVCTLGLTRCEFYVAQ